MSESSTSVHKPRVLLVDDDPGIRYLLSRFLDLEGYAVTEARDTREAMSAISADPPDLLLLDATLPYQDGFDFLSQLRRSTDVPVIMLTGCDEGSRQVLGLRLGADDYIVKPFAIHELSARIASVLGGSGPRPRLADQERAI